MNPLPNKLSHLLANTYALYLKTQNYHWHVKGPHFYPLHQLLEAQYKELAEAVDALAERMVMMGHQAPATFKEFMKWMTLKEGDSSLMPQKMVRELADDHQRMISEIHEVLEAAQAEKDEGSVALLSERILAHEKSHWMLSASIS